MYQIYQPVVIGGITRTYLNAYKESDVETIETF